MFLTVNPYLFIPPVVEHVRIIPRVTHKFSFEECHIETRRVVVDKLKEEHLHGEPVLILKVGSWDFCKSNQTNIKNCNAHCMTDRQSATTSTLPRRQTKIGQVPVGHTGMLLQLLSSSSHRYCCPLPPFFFTQGTLLSFH